MLTSTPTDVGCWFALVAFATWQWVAFTFRTGCQTGSSRVQPRTLRAGRLNCAGSRGPLWSASRSHSSGRASGPPARRVSRHLLRAGASVLTAYAVATGLDVRATLRRQWKLGVDSASSSASRSSARSLPRGDAPPARRLLRVRADLARRDLRGGRCVAADGAALPGRLSLARWPPVHMGAADRLLRSLARARLTITAVYHLGFAQYRHDGIGAPETGNTLISIPMLLSTNPIGSIADHMAMHISAVTHTYETTVDCPRQQRRARAGDDSATPSRRIAPRAKPLLGSAGNQGVSRSQSSDCRCPLSPGVGPAPRPHVPASHPRGAEDRKPHATVAMTVTYDRKPTRQSSAGPGVRTPTGSRNIRARPALQIQIGRELFTPEQRFLTEDESFAAVVEFRRRHPWRLRLVDRILGWGDLRDDTAVESSCTIDRSCHSARRTPPGPKTAPASSCCDSGRLWAGRP